MRIDRVLIAIALVGTLAGCTLQPVQPWQRGHLARWDMQWDPDPLQRAQEDHAHFSKEGSNGSVGAAGGGCGCN